MRLSTLPIFTGLAAVFVGLASTAADLREEPGLRRPLALVLDRSAARLDVANRCGSLSTIDTRTGRVVFELAIGKRLESLAPLGRADSVFLIAVDSQRHELVVLKKHALDASEPTTVAARIPVSRHPVSCLADLGGNRVYVASLWSRRVTCLEHTGPADRVRAWRVAWQRDLPYAPRVLLRIPGSSHLLVADAFGNRLGVLEAATGRLHHTREIPGHQFRGMVMMPDGETIVLAQQLLNPLARTDDNDVHWGILMSNDLRWLQLASLVDPRADLFDNSHMTPLGEAGHAAADPAGIAVLADSTVVVSLGGVGEIAYGKPSDYTFRRMRVGRRPTSLVADSTRKLVYVANTFDDSISVVDLQSEEVAGTWALGPSRPLSLAERGEVAFYDGGLSMDGWMTCHSCHIDGHTNGQLNDNMSDGSYETSKRVLSLLGKAGTAPFAWAGTSSTLETQVGRSIRRTMRRRSVPDEETVRAIAAFLRTLPPPPGIDLARGQVEASVVERGRELFASLGCRDCHLPPLYTTANRYDVGLVDEQGLSEFNPPSLLGVSQRDRWLHDGRAESLVDVFGKYRHQLERPLEEDDLAALVAFLRQL